jgi:hypothetical protein
MANSDAYDQMDDQPQPLAAAEEELQQEAKELVSMT